MPSIVFVCDSRLHLASVAALLLRRAATQRQLPLIHASAATFAVLPDPAPAAVVMALAESGFDLAANPPLPFTRAMAMASQRIIWITEKGQTPDMPIEFWDVSPAPPDRGDPIQAIDSVASARAALLEARRLRDAISDRVERLILVLMRQEEFGSVQ